MGTHLVNHYQRHKRSTSGGSACLTRKRQVLRPHGLKRNHLSSRSNACAGLTRRSTTRCRGGSLSGCSSLHRCGSSSSRRSCSSRLRPCLHRSRWRLSGTGPSSFRYCAATPLLRSSTPQVLVVKRRSLVSFCYPHGRNSLGLRYHTLHLQYGDYMKAHGS